MTREELIKKASDILEGNGYTVVAKDTGVSAEFAKDGKGALTEDYRMTGLLISLNGVYKHNAADESISVDVTIRKWDRGGVKIAKERINTRMTDRAINNRMKKIMSAYEAV